jgi:hypothetical protein
MSKTLSALGLRIEIVFIEKFSYKSIGSQILKAVKFLKESKSFCF